MLKPFRFIIIFIFIFTWFKSSVLALSWPGKKTAPLPLKPKVYGLMEKKKLIEDYLKKEGIDWQKKLKDLSPEKRNNLISKIKSILSLNLTPQPKFEEKDGWYVFTTGANGNVKGKIPWGEYQIELEPVKEVELISLGKIQIFSQIQKRLYVGLKKGKGIKYVKKVSLPLTDKVIGKSSLSLLSNEDLVIQLFSDKNSNGQWDQKEKPVLWAGVKIKLKKISLERKVSFKKGINNIEFERVPKNFKTATQFLLAVMEANGNPEWLSDGYKMIVLANGQKFGRDFALVKNKKYWFSLKTPADLVAIY